MPLNPARPVPCGGLLGAFCGTNMYRSKKIVPVRELLEELCSVSRPVPAGV